MPLPRQRVGATSSVQDSARPLDIYSITQTSSRLSYAGGGFQGGGNAPHLTAEDSAGQQESAGRCKYGAPFFAKNDNGRWLITQGNCHHWDCPRCGIRIASMNYGRIVAGARKLTEHGGEFAFVTLTSRGQECSLAQAESDFLLWTNRLFTAWRARTKRAGGQWEYVAITERQARGHPHLHMLTLARVGDEVPTQRYKMLPDGNGKKRRAYYWTLRSDWLEERIASAGLGREYDVQVVNDIEAASRYIAKYLFKASSLTIWPNHWRRVRYSKNWPKLEREKADGWYPVVSTLDWMALEHAAPRIVPVGGCDLERLAMLYRGVILTGKKD